MRWKDFYVIIRSGASPCYTLNQKHFCWWHWNGTSLGNMHHKETYHPSFKFFMKRFFKYRNNHYMYINVFNISITGVRVLLDGVFGSQKCLWKMSCGKTHASTPELGRQIWLVVLIWFIQGWLLLVSIFNKTILQQSTFCEKSEAKRILTLSLPYLEFISQNMDLQIWNGCSSAGNDLKSALHDRLWNIWQRVNEYV